MSKLQQAIRSDELLSCDERNSAAAPDTCQDDVTPRSSSVARKSGSVSSRQAVQNAIHYEPTGATCTYRRCNLGTGPLGLGSNLVRNIFWNIS